MCLTLRGYIVAKLTFTESQGTLLSILIPPHTWNSENLIRRIPPRDKHSSELTRRICLANAVQWWC